MKNRMMSNRYFWMLLFCLTLGTNVLMAQATETVTLYVDTDRLQNNTPANEVNNYCNFGQDPSISNEDYLIEVNVGDVVNWRGVANNGVDIVNIEKIIVQGGPNPFPADRDELDGGGDGGRVVSVQMARATGNETCKYMVKFSIQRGDAPVARIFDIDPRLRVMQE
ncbi:hypothetical protein [Robertkochia sediminum]|uniref:hypothetical protein n=1 Tax=Robertkochia sediminum TaxID=2785326 RepID=UPI001931978C|nr:hypothetical protein [Robertkochia sediminum]MBL7473365.1 hypothetical protein [Robertkochia sediminum]